MFVDLLIAAWAAFLVGFLAGCWWSSRARDVEQLLELEPPSSELH